MVADLYELLVNRDWREDFTGRLSDPLLREFWENEWPLRNRSAREPSVEAVLNKLGGYLSYPSIREIVATPYSTIRPRRIMDAGDVLLVDLSRVGRDHARLFGGMLIGRFYVDALGRQAIPLALRRPHQLYVDEVQNFDTSSLRGIHTEGRKFALRLTLATQYLRSLGIDLQSAIRANVATLALLQPSARGRAPARRCVRAPHRAGPVQPAPLPDGHPDRVRRRDAHPHDRCPPRAATAGLDRCGPAPQRRARRSRPARNARWMSLSWSGARSATRSATTGTSAG